MARPRAGREAKKQTERQRLNAEKRLALKERLKEEEEIPNTEPEPEPNTDMVVVESAENAPIVDDFESFSPLLNQEVVERSDDIPLSAQPIPEAQEPVKSKPFKTPRAEEGWVNPPLTTDDLMDEPPQSVTNEEVQETARRMEITEEPVEENPSIEGIQKKAGQTTAKYAWTLYETFGPKVQKYFTEAPIGKMNRLASEDKIPKEFVDYCKDHNEKLEELFEVEEWEKELIYEPLKEVLEEEGLNASISPKARLVVGITTVVGYKVMQSREIKKDLDDKFNMIVKSYAAAKKDELPLMETEEVFQGRSEK